jgi:DNA topoisomerase-1
MKKVSTKKVSTKNTTTTEKAKKFMKKLLIVESPAKIKTISKFLGSDFKIMSTVGHIKDLPTKKLGIVMGDPINIEYVTIEDKDKIIADICKQAASSGEIYLAPDPDREGEIIAWHIGQEIEKVAPKGAKIYRITFNEITKTAILESVKNPSEVDLRKVAAQQARRVLDRWVGYEVSPVLWQKIMRGLSAGRVQSVALKLICDREEEIRAFKVEEYWSIHGEFKQKTVSIPAELASINQKKVEITTKEQADSIVADIKKQAFTVASIEDKQRQKNPLPPFMTSTLQQAAYNRLGFNVKKTMQVAQGLYEGLPLSDPSTPVALITYMRTDSLRISETALKQSREYIHSTFGDKYLPSSANFFEKKKAAKVQDAHEAIRPIDVNITPDMVEEHLPKDSARLYRLIWQRFVACQMTQAIFAQRVVTITSPSYVFKTTGSTLVFDGFLKVYAEDEDEKEKKVIIPAELEAQKASSLTKVDGKQHFTQPPARYTEATLVKEMEKEGIGRPSTYATIMNTIRARNYTTLDEKKRFVPTELGMKVTHMLVENLPHIMNIKFTALMEEDLDKIAQGELERDILLKEFYKNFSEDLEAFRGTKGKKATVPTDILCPQCKKHNLAIRFGKSGEFIGCPGYPDCTFTANFERTPEGKIVIVEAEKPKLLDVNCPKCGKPLREIIGRFGPFVACSGYPECKYIHQEMANFPCPQCGNKIGKRTWKGKIFWGCTKYPECKFAIFSDIEQTPCPTCKNPYLLKRFDKEGNVTLTCPKCNPAPTKK